ncbi:hypothetical protein HYV30_04340 [Candidatus Kaiserbacteria bacterium]|nr:hypothetical protein [Candidatus Kaiserbacteria bacterium]
MHISAFFRIHTVPLLSILLFCALVLVSSALANIKYRALSFEGTYYLPFAVKAFNPNLQKHLAADITGNNMFFMQGIDGGEGLYHWIHFEPVKLFNALLYSAVPSVFFLFLVWTVLYFLPLIYIAVIAWKPRSASAFLLLAGVIASAIYPSSVITMAGNLSPWVLLSSFSILFTLSIICRRGLAENLFFLNLLLFVREEALIFSAAAIAYVFIRERFERQNHRVSKLLFLNWLAWAAIVFTYVFWVGYPIILPPLATRALQHPIFLSVLAAIGAVLAFLMLRVYQRVKAVVQPYECSIAFAAVSLTPIAFYVLIWLVSSLSPILLIYSRFGILAFTMTVLTILSLSVQHKRIEKKAIGALLGCIVLFVGSELVPYPYSTFTSVSRYNARRDDAALVFLAQREISPQDSVLIDEHTDMVFYAHNNAYNFNSLPVYLLPHLSSWGDRNYPANEKELISLIKNGTQYAVLGRSNAATVTNLIRKAGKHAVVVEENESFVFYKIER